jgi:hypothetical protein
MKITDQTRSVIPEIESTASFEQTKLDVAHIAISDLSGPDGIEMPVIARIPDLDAPSTPHKHKHIHSSRTKTATPTSPSSRILSSALSLKLLIGIGLVVVIGAVASHVAIQINNNLQSKVGDVAKQAWQTPAPAPTADLAPIWRSPASQQQVSSDVSSSIAETIAPASPMLLTSSNATTAKKGKTTNKPAVKTISADEQAEFSVWPNPAHPILAEADSQQNESLTADRRNSETGAAQFEGTINTPSDRNTNERTRSSIY